jgi:hypothetical protein
MELYDASPRTFSVADVALGSGAAARQDASSFGPTELEVGCVALGPLALAWPPAGRPGPPAPARAAPSRSGGERGSTAPCALAPHPHPLHAPCWQRRRAPPWGATAPACEC